MIPWFYVSLKSQRKNSLCYLLWHLVLFLRESWHIAGQMISLTFFFTVLYTSQELFLYDCNRAVKITACGGGLISPLCLLQHLLLMKGLRMGPNQGDTACECRMCLGARLADLRSRAMASGSSVLLFAKGLQVWSQLWSPLLHDL